jgi:hypothetical protein
MKILSLRVRNLLVERTITHINFVRHSFTIAFILNWDDICHIKKGSDERQPAKRNKNGLQTMFGMGLRVAPLKRGNPPKLSCQRLSGCPLRGRSAASLTYIQLRAAAVSVETPACFFRHQLTHNPIGAIIKCTFHQEGGCHVSRVCVH